MTMTSRIPIISIVLIAMLSLSLSSGCKAAARAKTEPIFRDAYSFYVLDPGPWTIIGPETPSNQEFLDLETDGVQIICGRFQGAFLVGNGAPDAVLEGFSRNTLEDPRWLPGCDRWFLDGSQMNIGERWYYVTTALVRRNAQETEGLSNLQKLVHKAEIEKYKVDEDRIVRLYYAFRDKDIYILTVDGTPEDIVTEDPVLLKLLANVRLKASEALAATESQPEETK
jgi:hypothetical protein